MPVVIAPATRETSGVSTSARTWLFSNLPFPTPPRLHQYFNDFDTYAAGDWTVTTGSTGSVGLTDGNGGLLIISSAGATNDIQAMQLVPKSFAFTTGSQMWFACNLSLGATATLGALQFGLANTHATPGTTTDGAFFSKAAGSASLTFSLRASSTSTTATVGTLVASTAYTFGFYYNGNADKPALFVYSTIGQTTANGLITPGNGSGYYSGGNYVAASFGSEYANAITNLPTANLTAGVGIKASTGATVSATLDYFYAGGEIVARY